MSELVIEVWLVMYDVAEFDDKFDPFQGRTIVWCNFDFRKVLLHQRSHQDVRCHPSSGNIEWIIDAIIIEQVNPGIDVILRWKNPSSPKGRY